MRQTALPNSACGFTPSRRRLLLALAAWAPAYSQQFSKDNLAPYIPSPQEVVDRMLSAARVKPGEMVYDLGSGDGRIMITAAQKFQARAVGVELRGDLCKSTQARIKDAGPGGPRQADTRESC